MNRIATMTVIRGDGEVEAIMNGVVSQELQRLQRVGKERMEAEREAMRAEVRYLRGEGDAAKMKRDRLLKDSVKRMRASMRRTWIKRVTLKIQYAWAWVYCLFAVLLGKL